MASENMAADYAAGMRETLADYWDAVDHIAARPADCETGDPDTCERCAEIRDEYGADTDDEIRDYLESSMVLELVWEVGEPFAVVLTVGGPHAEITGGGRAGGYVLETYWGCDRASLRGAAVTRTGDYFRTMLEEVGR